MSDPSQIGEAFVRIRPKADPGTFQRETEQAVAPAVRGAGDSLGRQLGDALTAGAFVAFSASVVRSAAEAEQAVGGTAAVFKDARGEIDAFAEGAAESLGLTEQATRQFASQIGSALKGYGFSIEEAADTSQQLITKGADLTALFGGTVPEAVTAMSAALRGEFDPLERYGVSLTAAAVAAKAVELGLADSTSEVTGHAKAVATLAIIEQQTADATGQFGRELGTAAGQMAVATAKLGDARDELGANFLPLVSKAAGAVSSMAEAFGALPGPVQASVAAIVSLVALSGPLGRVKDKISEAAAEMREGGEAATKFRGQLNTLAKTGVIVAGITAITAGIEAFNDAQDREVASFAEKLPDTSDIQGYRDAVNAAVERTNFLSDELNKFGQGGSADNPAGILEAAGQGANFFTSALSGNVSEVGALKAEYDALSASLPAATLKAEELTTAVNTLGDRLGISGVAAAEIVKQFKGLDLTQVPMEKLVQVLSRFQRGEIDAQTAAQELGVGVSTAGDKAAEAAEKFDDLKAGLFGVIDASNAYTDAAQGVVDAQLSAERAQRSVVDATRAHQAALESVSDAQDSHRDSVRAVEDAERRRVESLRSVEDATRSVEEAQRRLDEALQGPGERDNLDLEAAEIRLRQMRQRLGEITDPDEQRLAQIDIRRAELDLAERRAEVDGRAAEAQAVLTDAQSRLTDAQRGAEDASRAVADAREAERDAVQAISDANYNAQRAAENVTDATRNAEQASRDVARAQFDQLKASEELIGKLGEEQAALAGANAEASKLATYYMDLARNRPELAAAIQPLIDLLRLAGARTDTTRNEGTPIIGDSRVAPLPRPDAARAREREGSGAAVQIGPFNGMDAQEAYALANQHLDMIRGF